MKLAMGGAAQCSAVRDAALKFFRRVADDFRHKELMPIKVLFFVQSSTLFVLYPFLTIHMKELGIGVEEAAAMNALSPFVAVLMPPLAGLLADRIGNFRILLSVLSALGGGLSLLLLLVPPARHHPLLPEQLSMVLEEVDDAGPLPERGFLLKPLLGHLPCSFHTHQGEPLPLALTLGHCGHSCPIQNISQSPNDSLRTNENSMSDLPESWVFLPVDVPVPFNCDPNCTNRRTTILSTGGKPSRGQPFLVNATVQRTSRSNDTNALKVDSMLEVQEEEDVSVAYAAVVAWMANAGADRPAEACRRACLVTTSRADVCVEKVGAEAVPDDPKLTFWAYLAVRVLLGAIGGTAFAMFEGAVIALLRRHEADYGLQRIYAALGAMIASPLSGLLLDAGGATDFRPAFYLYAALKVICGLLVLTIDLEFKAPAKRVVKEVFTALRNWELMAILGAALALGAAWGFLEGFLFWLLQDLGATKMLMGLTVTVGGAAGLPLLALAGPITDRIGHHAVIAISFLVYAVRLLGYSLLVNPWLCLIFEAMEGVTSSLAVTACVTAVASRSSTSTDSSLQGLLGGLYYGVGRGIGSLFGGLLMGALGARATFRLFAGMCAAVGAVYLWASRGALGRASGGSGDDPKAKAEEAKGGVVEEKKEEEGHVNLGVDLEECEAVEGAEENVSNEEDGRRGKSREGGE